MNDAVSLLYKHEGIRRSPYRDTAGNLTVGIGHNLSVRPIVPEPSYPISVARCFEILRADIADVEDDLAINLPWYPRLDMIRQAAVTDLCFNVGIASLMKFSRFLTFMAASDWGSAADDLFQTLWAREVHQRAVDISGMIRTGRWP